MKPNPINAYKRCKVVTKQFSFVIENRNYTPAQLKLQLHRIQLQLHVIGIQKR